MQLLWNYALKDFFSFYKFRDIEYPWLSTQLTWNCRVNIIRGTSLESLNFTWKLVPNIVHCNHNNLPIPFLDINECANQNGGCNHVCSNNNGSYACSCRAGFFLDADKKSCSGKRKRRIFFFTIRFLTMYVYLSMSRMFK